MFQFQFSGCHPQLPFSFTCRRRHRRAWRKRAEFLRAAAFLEGEDYLVITGPGG